MDMFKNSTTTSLKMNVNFVEPEKNNLKTNSFD